MIAVDDVEICEATEAHRTVCENLSRYYTYDISEFASDLEDYRCQEDGNYHECISHLWPFARREFFLLRAGGEWAGYACVSREDNVHFAQFELTEFFVVRKFRKQGLGKRFISELLERHPGAWEVAVWPANEIAKEFWEHTIPQIASGTFECVEDMSERFGCVMQTYHFDVE